MKPTIYVSINSHRADNPLQLVIVQVMSVLGCEPMEQVVKDEVEADIAVTNSIAVALKTVKETETTTVALTYWSKEEKANAKALASRFPDRIHAVPYVGCAEGEMDVMPFLLKLVAEKTKEAK